MIDSRWCCQNLTYSSGLLYATSAPLTIKDLRQLAGDDAKVEKGFSEVKVTWRDAQVTLSTTTDRKKHTEDLEGLVSFLERTGAVSPSFKRFINRVHTFVNWQIGEIGTAREAERFLVSLACTYGECMFHYCGRLYNPLGICLFGSNEEGDRLLINPWGLPVTRLKPPALSTAQSARQSRLRTRLEARLVPLAEFPFVPVTPDERQVRIRCRQVIQDRLKMFALGPVPPFNPGQLGPANVGWHANFGSDRQAALVLAWALGVFAELPWPEPENADEIIPRIHSMLSGETNFPASPRSVGEILDELEFATQLTWAVTSSAGQGESIPEDLNWASGSRAQDIAVSVAVAELHVRLQTLQWLTCQSVRWLPPQSLNQPTWLVADDWEELGSGK